MCFFEQDSFLRVIKTYKEETFSYIVPVVDDLADNHWHEILRESYCALKMILLEVDFVSYKAALTVSWDNKS